MKQCGTCKYSVPIQGDIEQIKQFIEESSKRAKEHDERMYARSRQGLSFTILENIYRQTVMHLYSRLDLIENCITCKRFPQTINKKKTDICGEYREAE